MTTTELLPLPYGWVQDIDANSGHPFYVDTKATPPRSIWVHPYEDEQYLNEHPEVREKLHQNGSGDLEPLATQKPSRPHSYHGESSSSGTPVNDEAVPGGSKKKKRGFLGKLKDVAIGTKEEREAERRNMLIMQERRRQALMARQAEYARYPQYGRGYPPFQQPYGQQQYTAPIYGRPQYMGSGYGFGGGRHRGGGMGGGGMGGMGLPLLGGLAGGLLLGDMLDGGFGGGGF